VVRCVDFNVHITFNGIKQNKTRKYKEVQLIKNTIEALYFDSMISLTMNSYRAFGQYGGDLQVKL
jgi:hypothetical protein